MELIGQRLTFSTNFLWVELKRNRIELIRNGTLTGWKRLRYQLVIFNMFHQLKSGS